MFHINCSLRGSPSTRQINVASSAMQPYKGLYIASMVNKTKDNTSD